VCGDVLNLQIAGLVLPAGSVLTGVYHITCCELEPLLEVLVQNLGAASRTQQGTFLIP